jgi:phosphatidate phosphatase APP1
MLLNTNTAIIKPYRGYLAGNKIYCLARVMKHFKINWKKSNRLSLFGASLKRWVSSEIPYAKVQINFLNHTFIVESNKEGFIVLDEEIPLPAKSEKVLPISFKIRSDRYNITDTFFQGEIINPGIPKRIIISDIDDTIIHTNVLSKVAMVYNSVMVGFENRKMISQANEFLHLLSDDKEYPVFYVSNSPFNLYEYLRRFLEFNKFQNGPLFLRDYGKENTIIPEKVASHKHYIIEKLLNRFPQSEFVLLGDGAEHDPYIFAELKEKYKERITHIFLRKIYGKKRHEILAKWKKSLAEPCIHIFDHYEEIIRKLKSKRI